MVIAGHLRFLGYFWVSYIACFVTLYVLFDTKLGYSFGHFGLEADQFSDLC